MSLKSLEQAIEEKRVELEDAKQAVLDARRAVHVIEAELWKLKVELAKENLEEDK